jgi:putative aldouronate transport system substrate-binding protein
MISLHYLTEFRTKILNIPPLCGGNFLFQKLKDRLEVFMKEKGLLFVVIALAMVSCSRGEKTQAPATRSKEITEIIWQYPSPGDSGPGFQEMEDALNAMMERDIGVHVRFEPVGLMESQQKAALMVSSGE